MHHAGMKILALVLAAGLGVASLDGVAQRFPGRDRGESPRDIQRKDSPRVTAALPMEPFSALERELPSLRADLGLKGEQVAAWQLFERDVRDLAEMSRQRTRFLMALRDPGDKPLPTANDLLGRITEEDRRKSDASTELKRHFDALYAMLDEAQRRMVDRRVVLSQTEPLGQEPPPKR